jgi:crotonobetainyl-CoA:carnitine CoA-transferase CaiB-like acyl-CoA transferase
VNLLSSLLGSLVNQGAAYLNGGGVPTAMGNQHPSIAPYETLAAQDLPLAVAIGNDRQFTTLTAAIGRPELGADPRFRTNHDRVGNRAALVGELESALHHRSAAEWTVHLQAHGLPCGPVNDIAQAITLAETLGLSPIVRLASNSGDIAGIANPVTLARTPTRYHRAPPLLGADNREVAQWLQRDDGGPISECG